MVLSLPEGRVENRGCPGVGGSQDVRGLFVETARVDISQVGEYGADHPLSHIDYLLHLPVCLGATKIPHCTKRQVWQGCSSTRHLSGFPWAPPTQDTGRCCTEMFIGVYRLVVFWS